MSNLLRRASPLSMILFSALLAIHSIQGEEGREEGLASWYGGKFHGRLTASGEVFDTNQLTAAHRTLPFGSIVRVTNKSNNQSIEVRINDRGPFVEGRIIDLSRAAAGAIGITGSGVAPVRIEIISKPEKLYKIQIGAYRMYENALKIKERIASVGLDAIIKKTEQGIHRVMIIDIREAALEEIRRRLQESGFKRFLIQEGRDL